MNSPSVRLKKKVFWISAKTWSYLFTWFKIFVFCLMIGSISTPRWVTQGNNKDQWTGGLIACSGCNGEWENEYYTTIKSISKENNLNGYLNTFGSLSTSGILYTVFESVSLFAMLFLITLPYICKLRSSLFYLSKIFALILCFSHTIAVLGWFFVTEAMFFNDCEKSTGYLNSEKICPTQGPVIAICIEFAVILIGVIYIFLKPFNYSKIIPRSVNTDRRFDETENSAF